MPTNFQPCICVPDLEPPTRNIVDHYQREDRGNRVDFTASVFGSRPSPVQRRKQSKAHHNRFPALPRRPYSWPCLLSLLCTPILLARGVQGSIGSEVMPLVPSLALLPEPQEPTSGPQMLARQVVTSSNSQGSLAAGAATVTSTGLETATATSDSSLPSPFDTSIGNNFTSSSCPEFFDSFLNNQTFEDCHALSLLILTSNGFFEDSRSLVSLTRDLQASCNANFNSCSAIMASLANQISQQSNCGEDLKLENPVVLEAYHGFLSYQPLYHAGCLTGSNGTYCYADAVTNASSTSASYVYYLPLAVSLPSGATLPCTSCLKNTMAIFAQTASNDSRSPLAKDYGPAAQQINSYCGASFAEAAVKTSGTSGLLIVTGLHTSLVSLMVILIALVLL